MAKKVPSDKKITAIKPGNGNNAQEKPGSEKENYTNTNTVPPASCQQALININNE